MERDSANEVADSFNLIVDVVSKDKADMQVFNICYRGLSLVCVLGSQAQHVFFFFFA